MKIIEKFKKVFLVIQIFFSTLATKVFGTSVNLMLNDPKMLVATAYGVYKPTPLEKIWNISKVFIIPIATIIGIIIYLKKSNANKKKKILVTIGIFILVIIGYFIINKIIYSAI